MARAALWSLHAVRMAPLVPEQFRIADVDYVLDTARAGQALGWRPQLTDADMLWSAYQTYVRSN
jgi:nucleoside-diphosphate-sugar epimerase